MKNLNFFLAAVALTGCTTSEKTDPLHLNKLPDSDKPRNIVFILSDDHRYDYWEHEYPSTPTMHGVRTDRYKYIRYYGIWDTNEFYDLQEDPYEIHNLIAVPELQDTIKSLNHAVYNWLEATDGMYIPLKRTERPHIDHRNMRFY